MFGLEFGVLWHAHGVFFGCSAYSWGVHFVRNDECWSAYWKTDSNQSKCKKLNSFLLQRLLCFLTDDQGCEDGVFGGLMPPNIFRSTRKLVKS